MIAEGLRRVLAWAVCIPTQAVTGDPERVIVKLADLKLLLIHLEQWKDEAELLEAQMIPPHLRVLPENLPKNVIRFDKAKKSRLVFKTIERTKPL
ncbi:MAG: hypothetical protein FJX23_03040 [Alphaproteobacteria bacterium]|nr:hypothetical protein [Alphaproteobacteria bacterium]